MEFDKDSDFPGLYSAESRRQEDSDYSEDDIDKLSKKDLLIGKRKDKKDKGYAALEGESSPEEDLETKSPSKTRRTNPFKFPSRREKREKSREKESKEKEQDRPKKKEHEKDKRKDKDKVKVKSKEKKKQKQPSSDIAEELPIFGVPLSASVVRNPCHDGVNIPLVVRKCIDYIETHGLTMEGLYKFTGVKSKVQHAFSVFNKREELSHCDFDITVATSLLKQYLRLLPDPVLTKEMSEFFENSYSTDVSVLKNHIAQLPQCNRDLLGWLFMHFRHVVLNEKHNKMSISLLSAMFCPSLQMSPRLFNTLVVYAEDLFPDVALTQYVPPLSSVSPSIECGADELNVELRKQESLLNLIHFEMNAGFINKQKEDELWGVQRNITQLKRKIKSLEKENRRLSGEAQDHATVFVQDKHSSSNEPEHESDMKQTELPAAEIDDKKDFFDAEPFDKSDVFESEEELTAKPESHSDDEELMLQYERIELITLVKELQDQIKSEKIKIQQLRSDLFDAGVDPFALVSSYSPAQISEGSPDELECIKEHNSLQVLKNSLLKNITEEKESILDLKVQVRLAETKKRMENSKNSQSST